MNYSEINLKKEGFTLSCNTFKKNRKYRFLMTLGRVFPTTRAQAKHFIKTGACLDVLNMDDVDKIESLLLTHGFSGNYKYTKSKTNIRLINSVDLNKAIKLEYNL